MQCHSLGVVVLLTAALASCASSPPRIDGSSPYAFVKSHEEMLQSLSPADRVRLTLAEMVVCTAAAATPWQLVPASLAPPPMASLMAVRFQLNGKTFDEILQYSKSLNVKVKVEFPADPPSNNRWRGP
jgi:hypothetical protein